MMVKQRQRAAIMETSCASLETIHTNWPHTLRCVSVWAFVSVWESILAIFPHEVNFLRLLSNSLIFLLHLNLRALGPAACPVLRCTGGMGWLDMLFSGHSRGHIYLFYGAKLTGALNNIPDACWIAFISFLHSTSTTTKRLWFFMFLSDPKLYHHLWTTSHLMYSAIKWKMAWHIYSLSHS